METTGNYLYCYNKHTNLKFTIEKETVIINIQILSLLLKRKMFDGTFKIKKTWKNIFEMQCVAIKGSKVHGPPFCRW